MSTQHTPGEWFATKNNDGSGWWITDGPVENGRVHPGTASIATVHNSCTAERTAANAALFKAAPDLLEACEAGLRELESMFHAQHSLKSAPNNPAHKQLTAAIAKAKGGVNS